MKHMRKLIVTGVGVTLLAACTSTNDILKHEPDEVFHSSHTPREVAIMRGLSYNAGSYAIDRTRAPKIERIATNTLCVTDQRLIFLSDVKNVDLPYARLLSSETGPSTIKVTRSNSGRLVFDSVDIDAIAAFEHLSGTSSKQRLDAEQQALRPKKPLMSAKAAAQLVVIIEVLLTAVWYRFWH